MRGNQAGEWQFDGLVGPTHNYAGLSPGNVASASNAGAVSNPRKAALQGLDKMRFVRDLGMPQCFLPPHYRPAISELKRIGFEGGTEKLLADAFLQAPHLLASVFSSSFMWAANAATVMPGADSGDGKLHLVPANLVSNFHRSIEPQQTLQLLRSIFHNHKFFTIHDPLPATAKTADEGAANHMRICSGGHTTSGLEIFTYGTAGIMEKNPKKFPARQTLEACESIARLGGIKSDCTFFVQQNPEAIDAGVFHNDVIAMNTSRLMIVHEKAFVEQGVIINKWKRAAEAKKIDWQVVQITENELAIDKAVKTYFFNSQLLELPNGQLVIVAPVECEEEKASKMLLEALSGGNGPLGAIHYRDVRESMKNGGGPACLRLRVAMTAEQAGAIHPGVILTDEKFEILRGWIEQFYRDRLELSDLRDPKFILELNEAYEALEAIIGMKGFYTSQM